MIKHGEAPYLECSSRGDKRFSAFYAKVNGKPIEQWYQEFKLIADDPDHELAWYERQGLRAENQEDCSKFYAEIWDTYIEENKHLIPVLISATGLSDVFGKEGHCCQATELWRIRNENMPG